MRFIIRRNMICHREISTKLIYSTAVIYINDYNSKILSFHKEFFLSSIVRWILRRSIILNTLF